MEIGKGGGGGEFRRVNVVYFLSRGGNVEHPHLIRVHHLHRDGVRLRDVKRWLSELRGKDMPDSFAWSYKRRYRSGYVWQDLTDDDLITPISDNEFVLKGSELPHRPLHPSSTINDLQPRPFPPLISEKSSTAATAAAAAEEEKEKEKEKEAAAAAAAAAAATTATAAERPKPNSSPAETLRIVLEEDDEVLVLSPNLPPPPPRDSSDESAAQRRRSAVFKIDACEAAEQARGRRQQQQQQQQEEEELQEREVRMAEESPSRSRSLRRASHVLRNILTCRVVDINDAALLPVSRPERSSCDGGGGGGGSQLAARRRTNLEGRHYDSRKSRSGGGKGTKMAGEKVAGVASAAAYKPFGAPYCSYDTWTFVSSPDLNTQCGKRFNPEKLHSHMKSCKALKARGNGYTNLQKGEYSRQVK